jgi:Zn-dependent protease
MFATGFWNAFKLRGIPVRFHWSVLLGALLFSGFRFAPAFWLAFPALVLIHELGHAWVIRRLGHRALGVEVTGFGGLCHWDPRFASRLHHALVAWGGVAAQFVLFLLTSAYVLASGGPSYLWEAEVVHVFTTTNLMLIVLNLLPIAPLDGARAWMLFGELSRVRR